MKILALQFKYFGDAVLLTPALRALREHFPQAELHLLVPAEMSPLFQNLPWLNRVWPMPRKRGSSNLKATLPFIRALRREKFDRSIDFASNDRGAILSFLIGAKQRLGWKENTGFWGRKFCYTRRILPPGTNLPEPARLARLLSGWNIPPPKSLEAEIRADPKLAAAAKKILPDKIVLCHLGTSRPRKEWPVPLWREFYIRAKNAGFQLAFSTGNAARERDLLDELRKLEPEIFALPPFADLNLFLAVLERAAVFISGDTGPLHFAAALGVPTIALFGSSSPVQWAPVGARHQALVGSACACDWCYSICSHPQKFCMAGISPEKVFTALRKSFSNV